MLLASLAAASVLAAPAGGTVVLALSFDELAAQAGRVVVGDVTSIAPRWSADGERIETVVEIAVQTELGSVSAGRTVRIVQPGGRIGDIGLVVAGMPEFRVGERVLVFLDARGRDGDGTAFHAVVGLAQGKFAVLPRLGGGYDVVQQLPGDLALAGPDATGTIRVLPPAPRLILDLDTALARIRLVRGEVTP